MYLFCDNSAVVDTVLHQKPKDPDLGSLLPEFLYIVFYPIIRHVDTSSNYLADHISRRYDHDSAVELFASAGMPGMKKLHIQDETFKLSAPW